MINPRLYISSGCERVIAEFNDLVYEPSGNDDFDSYWGRETDLYRMLADRLDSAINEEFPSLKEVYLGRSRG